MAMEKKYGKSVAQQLANPANYITRSQADAMGLGTEKELLLQTEDQLQAIKKD